MRYFKGSFAISALGLVLGTLVGYYYTQTVQGALQALLLTAVLGVLEVSLSFDNAVVNATVLQKMTPVWRQRFITWGILIAVFGMRIVFPLVIVSVVASINPWQALVLASTQPSQYAEIMLSSHLSIAGFGGSFLLMVALAYFLDQHKDVHWLEVIERPLAKLGKMQAVEIGTALVLFYVLSLFLDSAEEKTKLLVSGIGGITTYIFVDGISSVLKMPESGKVSLERASVAMFVYLEILDASFSFDGVIGAFALTNNLFIIAAGLGIGAMFVRSMTIYLVEQNTLTQFQFLEHGAFYAIGALALLMLLDIFVHVPEVVTGLFGAAIIGWSLISSIRHARKQVGV